MGRSDVPHWVICGIYTPTQQYTPCSCNHSEYIVESGLYIWQLMVEWLNLLEICLQLGVYLLQTLALDSTFATYTSWLWCIYNINIYWTVDDEELQVCCVILLLERSCHEQPHQAVWVTYSILTPSSESVSLPASTAISLLNLKENGTTRVITFNLCS